MSAFSHLIGFTDYTDFSIFKSFFWNDDKKEEKNKVNEKKGQNKKTDKKNIKKININKKHKYELNEKQKQLILKLEAAFDNYLYRKKVKNLLQLLKDNYMIVCTANIPNLYLNIIKGKKVKQYKLTYEPILKQNVAFLPRKVYRNKKKLKFIICNLKKEIFIEPLYKTEYEDGSFVNILDIPEIKEKEYKNEEDFNKFLKDYFKNNKKEIKKEENKIENNNNNIIKVNKKEQNNNQNNIIRVNKKEDNNKLNSEVKKKKKNHLHRRLKSDSGIKNVTTKKTSTSLLKDNSFLCLNSILKGRSTHRIKNERKISFGKVQFSY